MTDTTKTEALRLADWLDALCRRDPKFCTKDERPVAAAELRRLAFAEIGLRDRLRDREMDLANVVQHRDRLAAECEELRKDVEHKDLCAEQLGRELMKAHAECEALKDAAGQARDALASATGYISEQTSAGCEIARALAAIDAAMVGKE